MKKNDLTKFLDIINDKNEFLKELDKLDSRKAFILHTNMWDYVFEKGKEKDDNPSYALFGLILGIIGLAYWLIFGFAIISFFITILSLMGPTY